MEGGVTIGMDPLVSVVMPVCNSEPYLCDSIGSVLKQSMTNFELIVVDDASADRSVEIIDEMAAADPPDYVYFPEREQGRS